MYLNKFKIHVLDKSVCICQGYLVFAAICCLEGFVCMYVCMYVCIRVCLLCIWGEEGVGVRQRGGMTVIH